MSAAAGKYVTFFLGDEEYGMEILAVHEIIGVLPMTRVPRTPPFVRGVINLRGRVISIIDLRRKFELPACEPGPTSCIIVVAAHAAHVGLLVDRVSEVADIGAADIAPPPPLGAGAHTDYLVGVAKSGARIRLLLDISRVIDAGDLAAAGAPGGAPTAA
ncbi:MAG TPA: chemotaxis protein CheW [Gemmatimonadaceae bacterium]|jgi:purine-binding chemotaxis protein CheW|nr:chemotaxis protein CheW [Gemmatimonadaceae bacterium]